MKRTKSEKERIDKGWEELHARIEKDGLLVPSPQHSSLSPWKVAALLVVIILPTIAILLSRKDDNPVNQLTIHHTGTSSTLAVLLEDSSIIYLNNQSSLTYPPTFAKESREVIFQGNAMFHIEGNPQRPFRIKVEDTELEVLGTTFYIKNIGTELLETGVRNGKVKINLSGNNQPIYINGGEKVTVYPNNRIERTNTAKEDFDGYTRHIHFKDETLSRVLQIINSLYEDKGLHFETTSDISDRKFTFTYTNNTPDKLAELISTTLGIGYHQKGNTIIFFGQEP